MIMRGGSVGRDGMVLDREGRAVGIIERRRFRLWSWHCLACGRIEIIDRTGRRAYRGLMGHYLTH